MFLTQSSIVFKWLLFLHFLSVKNSYHQTLNSATFFVKSTCPMNTDLQQYLSKPKSSKTFFGSSPFSTRFLKSSYKCPTTRPHEKHLTGIIIYLLLLCLCLLAPFLLREGLCGSVLLGS